MLPDGGCQGLQALDIEVLPGLVRRGFISQSQAEDLRRAFRQQGLRLRQDEGPQAFLALLGEPSLLHLPGKVRKAPAPALSGS